MSDLYNGAWESLIKTICDEMRTQVEGEVIKAVQRVGIDVDKDELIKALNYDRKQYEKGLLEGYAKAKSEIIRCKNCRHSIDYYHDGDCYCSNPKWELTYFGGSWEFYCADAERREDERNDI